MATRFARLDVRGRYAEQNFVITFMYANAVRDLRDDALPDLAESFRATVLPNVQACMVTAAAVESLVCSALSPDINDRMTYVRPTPVNGLFDSPGMPPAVAAVITRKPALNGTRRFRGRIFLPAVPIADIAGGVIVGGSAYLTNLQGLADRMLERIFQFTPDTSEWLWYPYMVRFRVRVAPTARFPALPTGETRVRLALGTQRHREPGHGRGG